MTAPKNPIVRMAERLRSGRAGDAPARPEATLESRRSVLSRIAARCAALAKTRYSDIDFKVIVKPSAAEPARVMLRCATRIVTIKISPSSEYFEVAGSGLGRRFTANPAHLQGDDPVLIAAEASSAGYGTEYLAADFMADAASGTDSQPL